VEKWFPTFFRGLRPGSAGAFVFAFVCVELATLARLSLDPVASASAMPYITYFPAILFATFFGGFWAGWTALVGAILLTWWWFLTPYHSFGMPTYAEIGTLAVFTLTASMIVGGAEHYRRMFERMKEEEHHRELLVAELEHRLKNKLATIGVILGHELRDYPDILRRVRGRLGALIAADEFIARSDGTGAKLKDLLAMEFAPFGGSRVRMRFEDVFLPAKAATIITLMFHELVTNAAKYGALSNPNGMVTVDCNVLGDEIVIKWVERGGPVVTTPNFRGFGTSLLERGLDTYRGRTVLSFYPAGLVCKLSLVLPDHDFQKSDKPRRVVKTGIAAA
jgi:two-component sensor histidine kinase